MSKIDESINLIKNAKNVTDDLLKSFVQSSSAITGITAYDLEPFAKTLYPVITPLRNSIPRVSGKGGIQANWRSITGININNLEVGVGEGNRSGLVATNVTSNTAAYKTFGLEDNVTIQADLAAQGFDDVKARAVEGLLRSMFIGEEKIIVGGNNSVALGTTPTPSLTGSTTGGSLSGAASPGTTYSVICVALAHNGYLTGSVSGGIRAAVSRSNADGSTDAYGGGAATQSSNATVALVSTSAGSISATVTAVKGAVGYAWFWGATGSEVLGAITTINSVLITATATGTQTAASLGTSDNSTNTLVYDGLISQICKSGSNSYYVAQATGTAGTGTALTSDTVGGITEVNTALKSFWDNYRLSPDTIWVSSQEMNNIKSKILLGGTNTAQRFSFDIQGGKLTGGSMVMSYLNPYTMNGPAELPIKIHPNIPAGTMLFTTMQLPYPLSNVPNPLVIRERLGYTQYEWPRTKMKYEYGVYVDSVLQAYFPPSLGMITNIGNG